MNHNRPFGVDFTDRKRIQCYTCPVVMEWVNKVCRSRGWRKCQIGTQALRWYVPVYHYVPLWISVDELLAGPPVNNRNPYLMQGYVDREQLEWLDGLSKSADDYLVDRSIDNVDRIKKIFFYRLQQRRGRSLELDRALKMYYKLAQVNPDILNISVEGVRPAGYEYAIDNYKDPDYLAASGEKIISILGIDLSKPPKINLLEEN